MKAGKYRELFSKLDADAITDEKVKNKLQSCRNSEKNIQSNNHKPAHLQTFSRVSILRPALPSLTFLIILLVAIIGIRIHFLSETAVPSSDITISTDTISEPNESLTDETAEVTASPNAETTGSPVEETTNTDEVNITEIPSTTSEDPGVDNYETPATDEIDSTTTDVTEDSAGDVSATIDNSEEADNSTKDGGFYFAYFRVEGSGFIQAIPNLVFRFYGTVKSIDTADLTDIILTRDGIPIDNQIIFTDLIDHTTRNNEVITDFYFEFTDNIDEPGIYGLTGKYRGVPFKADKQIIEALITEEPADPEDLKYISFSVAKDENNKFVATALEFVFSGLQNSFYLSDLTELKLTCGFEEIPYSLGDYIRRYGVNSYDNNTETMFEVFFKEPLTKSGIYTITGKYKGKTFIAGDISVP